MPVQKTNPGYEIIWYSWLWYFESYGYNSCSSRFRRRCHQQLVHWMEFGSGSILTLAHLSPVCDHELIDGWPKKCINALNTPKEGNPVQNLVRESSRSKVWIPNLLFTTASCICFVRQYNWHNHGILLSVLLSTSVDVEVVGGSGRGVRVSLRRLVGSTCSHILFTQGYIRHTPWNVCHKPWLHR